MEIICGKAEVLARAARIRALGLDVDGVLSDGRLYFTSTGEEMKAFHALDGHGIKMFMQAGLEVTIITSRASSILDRRCADLGIKHLYQGVEDKLAAMEEFLAATGLKADQFCFVGDDLMDLPVLQVAGLACTVPGGHEDVHNRAHLVTSVPGGSGAVREITDFLLRAQQRYDQFLPP